MNTKDQAVIDTAFAHNALMSVLAESGNLWYKLILEGLQKAYACELSGWLLVYKYRAKDKATFDALNEWATKTQLRAKLYPILPAVTVTFRLCPGPAKEGADELRL